ncbi:MAG: hypoxanthine phosphoribosyltransferase [Bdellovibrionales bacterium]|nr:hypoxanthine phosphoribosyltransferase [Bdellovibrionales bacterium]
MSKLDDFGSKLPRILISEPKLKERVAELAREIRQDYAGKEVVAVCVLKGSFIFFTDLIRQLDLTLSTEFLGVKAYNRSVSSGEVKVTLDINEPLEGKHVLVIEDVVHSGLTLNYIMNLLRARRPASLKSCALLVKEERLKIAPPVDYWGFKLGKEFVVGYGIDYDGKHRGLPYIGMLEHDH